MDLKSLRYFAATAEELHFGRAAERLGIAQPPLSIAVRKLESELGVRLFDRSTRRVELTAAGEELLRHARVLAAGVAAAREAVKAAAAESEQVLRIGFNASAALGLLPDLVRAHRERWPRTRLEIVEFTAIEVEAELRAGRFEIAVLRGPLWLGAGHVETLVEERLLLALPSDHRLAGVERVNLAAARAEPFVLFPRSISPVLFDTIVSCCLDAGFSPGIVQEAQSWAAVSALVAAGVGITIAPASARFLHPQGLVFRPLADDRARTPLVAAWPKRGLSPAAADFLATAREVFRGHHVGTGV